MRWARVISAAPQRGTGASSDFGAVSGVAALVLDVLDRVLDVADLLTTLSFQLLGLVLGDLPLELLELASDLVFHVASFNPNGRDEMIVRVSDLLWAVG